MPRQNCRVASASGRARSSSGKREGMGSRPATSTLCLRRAASTSACIVPWLVDKRVKGMVPRGRSRGTSKDPGWLLDLVLERVARGELRHLGCGYVDPLLGLRVDTLPGVALLHVELAEARDLDLLAVLEAVRHDLGERVEEPLGITLGGVRLAGDLLYQRRLVQRHFFLPTSLPLVCPPVRRRTLL